MVALATAPATFAVQLGDLPGWFEAVGTVGAFSVAAGVLVRERRARHRAQAERVAGWISLDDEGFSLRVSNTSDLPVFDVGTALISETSKGSYGFWPATIPPHVESYTDPNTNWALNATWERMRERNPEARSPDASKLYLSFRDAAGQRWIRTATGELRAMRSEDAQRRFYARLLEQPEPKPGDS